MLGSIKLIITKWVEIKKKLPIIKARVINPNHLLASMYQKINSYRKIIKTEDRRVLSQNGSNLALLLTSRTITIQPI